MIQHILGQLEADQATIDLVLKPNLFDTPDKIIETMAELGSRPRVKDTHGVFGIHPKDLNWVLENCGDYFDPDTKYERVVAGQTGWIFGCILYTNEGITEKSLNYLGIQAV